jgi:uncharacterized membrane protein
MMGRDGQTELLKLASLLLATATLGSCDGATTDIRYDDTDKGITVAEPNKADREKCYGVARAQYNDCAAGPSSDCAGTATKDYMSDRWKYVPAGECDDLGGSLIPGEPLPDA